MEMESNPGLRAKRGASVAAVCRLAGKHPRRLTNGCPKYKVGMACTFFIWESDVIHGELLARVWDLEADVEWLNVENSRVESELLIVCVNASMEQGINQSDVLALRVGQQNLARAVEELIERDNVSRHEKPRTLPDLFVAVFVVFMVLF